MKFISLLIALTALLLSSGCAPDASKVCSHLSEVYKGNVDPPGYLSEQSRCIEHFEMRKKQYGVNSYRREVECILGSTRVFDVKDCTEKENRKMK